MTDIITSGQLSILHSLRDGDEPLMRAPDEAVLFYERDLRILAGLGFLVRDGDRLALTAQGLVELQRPANALAIDEGS